MVHAAVNMSEKLTTPSYTPYEATRKPHKWTRLAVFGFVGCAAIAACVLIGVYTFDNHHTASDHPDERQAFDTDGPQISISPNPIQSGSWVTVSFSGLLQGRKTGDAVCIYDSKRRCVGVQDSSTWIGVYHAGANTTAIGPQEWPTGTAPWTHDAPIKFKPVNGTSGTAMFFMEAARTAIQFVLFTNGTDWPIAQATSEPLIYTDVDLPNHVHLALTHDISQMRVMWLSGHLDADAQVKYGTSPGEYTGTARAVPSTYTADDVCGPPANAGGWVDPGYFYNAIVKNIAEGQVIYYIVGSDSHGYSQEFRFKGPKRPNPNAHMYLTVIADMGETYIDGAYYHWMEPYAYNTTNGAIHAWDGVSKLPRGMRGMTLNAPKMPSGGSGRTSPPHGTNMKRMGPALRDGLDTTDVLLHVGDIAYATGYASEWDRFMTQIEPVAARVPYMTSKGNHERDFPDSGSYFAGSDSGGECGWPTEARFIMPTPGNKQDPGWYSFDMGSVHVLQMATEHECAYGSPQYSFIEADLKKVNRTVTPWVILTGHRPMYTLSHIDPDFQHIERLLMDYKVDLVLWGHVHNAQRTCPVFNGTCITTMDSNGYDAPIHAIIGNAGQSLSKFPDDRATWSLYQAFEYGYSTIEILSKNLLTMRFYSDDGNELHHEFSITRTRN